MMDLPQYPTTIIYISTSDIPKNFKPIKFFFSATNPNKREKKNRLILLSHVSTLFLLFLFCRQQFFRLDIFPLELPVKMKHLSHIPPLKLQFPVSSSGLTNPCAHPLVRWPHPRGEHAFDWGLGR